MEEGAGGCLGGAMCVGPLSCGGLELNPLWQEPWGMEGGIIVLTFPNNSLNWKFLDLDL